MRRGGALLEIDATALVPGDLLLLAEGDRLSAFNARLKRMATLDARGCGSACWRPCWWPADSSSCCCARAGPPRPTDAGAPLLHAYLVATTMSFAGITACQVGTAFAARTSRASPREIGVFSNPTLLGGIAFELVFAAAL